MIKKILLILVIVCTIGWAYTKTGDNAEGNDTKEEKGVPNYINYQGYLTDNSGNPINGSKSITFSIWTALSGGIQVWTTTLTVSVEKGLFYKDLSVPYSVFSSGARRWLQIKVDTETLSPRTEITSAGFSYRTTKSDTASYANNSDKLDNHNWGDLYPNADKVDNIHASTSASANKLLALNSSGKFPNSVLYTGSGNGLDADKLDGYHYNNLPYGNGDITAVSAGSGLSGGGTSGSVTLSFNTSYTVPNADKVDGYHASSTPTPDYCYVTQEEAGSPTLRNVIANSSARAVAGENNSSFGTGVYGLSNGGYGVHGYSASGVGVYYSGGLSGTGSKNCIVRTSKGPTLFYCQESPESWFEDFGSARLFNGKAHINLDPVFLEAVTITDEDPLKVFIQLNGECNGVYVVKDRAGFDVIEFNNGGSNVAFDYRVVAKRKGFEKERLEVYESAYNDPYLYPERAKKFPGANPKIGR